jgi:RNA recognition motif. (a.k.a. RRM, RBD, or RNP domain)
LLQAFGKVKAFHLVKNDPDSMTSKGYCFVEYADPGATQVAVIGLNGMDLGGGKVLTARVAGERSDGLMPSAPLVPSVSPILPGSSMMSDLLHQTAALPLANHGPPMARPDSLIIQGYDVEVLVDAAMGLRPMPTGPTHFDQFGIPMMRGNAVMMNPVMALPIIQQPIQQLSQIPQLSALLPPVVQIPVAGLALPPGSSALDIANAALDAAFGGISGSLPPSLPPQQHQECGSSNSSRILVLHNMVMDEDLEMDEDYNGLMDEVRGECAKYGKLLGMKVPRRASDLVQSTAIKKIFLEYATTQDAMNAEDELSGRQFGPNVVRVSHWTATWHENCERCCKCF